jgi:hypothetical protein
VVDECFKETVLQCKLVSTYPTFHTAMNIAYALSHA